jgi:predicted nicotinamide N-methyase
LPLFGIVWESSEILAKLMLDYHAAGNLAGKRILDVGCGMGLVSLLLNTLDADITAMDVHAVTEEFLERNVSLNHGGPIPFVNASWSEKLNDLGRFDLLLGSDVLYEPGHIDTMAFFLDSHLSSTGEVIIVDPDRGQLEGFRGDMIRYGFKHEDLRPNFLHGERSAFAGIIDRFSRQ